MNRTVRAFAPALQRHGPEAWVPSAFVALAGELLGRPVGVPTGRRHQPSSRDGAMQISTTALRIAVGCARPHRTIAGRSVRPPTRHPDLALVLVGQDGGSA
jgi:hypothetical protein